MRFIFANFSAIISFNAYYKHYEIRQDMNCLNLFSEVQFLRAIIVSINFNLIIIRLIYDFIRIVEGRFVILSLFR